MRGLIVGQGIAGTVLAWTLQGRGIDIQVAEAGFPHQSSGIAAGIINPVTGKRFVKTWLLDSMYPKAKSVYQTMEEELDISIWHEQNILRCLDFPQQINDWSLRLCTPGYANILSERSDAGSWTPILATGSSFGKIKNAARVDFSALLVKFRNEALAQGFLLQKEISPQDAESMSGDFDFIVFCEGYRAIENPFFPNLPWQLSKGEAMLLQIQHPQAGLLKEMIKKKLLLVPLGGGQFWAGASYDWEFDDTGATEKVQGVLEKQLAEMLRVPFHITHKMGAIRPTVKDRRPFIGASSSYSKIFIFNGLGTKGGLLAPFWAAHLADHILEGKELDAQVDIRRYS